MGWLSDVGNDISSAGSGIGDFVSQATKSIGNYYGFDSSGKWTNSGGIFKWMDEGLGEVTGRNQSRQALNLSRDQFSYAQQQANDLITQQNWQRQQSDLNASSAAGAARTSNPMGNNYNNATPLAMGPGAGQPAGKDFLGL